jgi:hypothetical protein
VLSYFRAVVTVPVRCRSVDARSSQLLDHRSSRCRGVPCGEIVFTQCYPRHEVRTALHPSQSHHQAPSTLRAVALTRTRETLRRPAIVSGFSGDGESLCV